MDEDDNKESHKVPAGVWMFWGVWGTAAAIAVIAYALRDYPNKYAYIQSVILLLTFIALVFYTQFTRKMQLEMVKQTNVHILPVLQLDIILTGEDDPQLPGTFPLQSSLRLKNIGHGTALNVKIESILVPRMGNLALQWVPIKFKPLYSLAVKETREVKDIQDFDVSRAHIVGEKRPELFGLLIGSKARLESELKIRFTDVLGNKYIQVVHLGTQGIWSDVVESDDGRVMRTGIKFNGEDWS